MYQRTTTSHKYLILLLLVFPFGSKINFSNYTKGKHKLTYAIGLKAIKYFCTLKSYVLSVKVSLRGLVKTIKYLTKNTQ